MQELIVGHAHGISSSSMANFYGVDFPEMRQTISAAVSSGKTVFPPANCNHQAGPSLTRIQMLFPNIPTLHHVHAALPVKPNGWSSATGPSNAADRAQLGPTTEWPASPHLGGMIFGFT